jgi:hypothetical protein
VGAGRGGGRVMLDEAGRGPFHGGSTPSSGYLAVFTLLQLCESLTVYGFGLDDDNGNKQVRPPGSPTTVSGAPDKPQRNRGRILGATW